MAATNTVSRNCSCRISIFLRHNMNFTGEKQNPVNFSRIMNGRNPGSRNSGDNCIFSLGHASLQLILPDYFLLLKKSQSSSCILSFFFFFFFFLSFFLLLCQIIFFFKTLRGTSCTSHGSSKDSFSPRKLLICSISKKALAHTHTNTFLLYQLALNEHPNQTFLQWQSFSLTEFSSNDQGDSWW